MSGAATLPSKTSFRYFFRKSGHHLTKICLDGIDYVDDDMLDIFAEMEKLETVELTFNMKITGEGIKRMVDNAKVSRYLTIECCIPVSDDTKHYISKKAKHVRISYSIVQAVYNH